MMTIVVSIIHRSQHLKPTTEACTESVSKQAKIHRLTDQYGSEPSIFFWVATIHCPFPIKCPKPYAWFSNLHAGVLVLAFEFSGKGLLSFTIHIPMIVPIGQKPSLKAPLAPRQSLHSLQVAPPW